jgi:hypothetical protein
VYINYIENMDYELTRDDIDIISDILKTLCSNARCVTIRDIGDKGLFDRKIQLCHILVSNGHAKLNVFNKNTFESTDSSAIALGSKFYEEAFKKQESNRERMSIESEKIALEIKKLKKNNVLIIPTFIIAIISLVISLVNVFC